MKSTNLFNIVTIAALWILAPAAAQGTNPVPALPLSHLVKEALQNNPEIQAALREREAAGHRISPAQALDDPLLEAGVINLPIDTRSFNNEDMTMKMIGLSQKFPYPGKRALRGNVAEKDAEAVGHASQETINRVVRDLKLAYFDLYLAQESVRLVKNNLLALDQLLRLVESKYTVGLASQTDVIKAQTQAARMQDDLIRLEREQSITEAELQHLLGHKLERKIPLPETLKLRPVPLDLEQLRQTALNQRPQLLALKTMVARNDKVTELARQDFLPDFDVRFSYGQRDRTLAGIRREDMITFTVGVNLPIWGESKVTPRIKEAVALREQANNLYQSQRNETATRLRQQIANARQSADSGKLYGSSILPQAKISVEASLSAYRVNRVDFSTLLDSQMSVFNYEIAYAAAVVNHNKALTEIDFITGKPIQ